MYQYVHCKLFLKNAWFYVVGFTVVRIWHIFMYINEYYNYYKFTVNIHMFIVIKCMFATLSQQYTSKEGFTLSTQVSANNVPHFTVTKCTFVNTVHFKRRCSLFKVSVNIVPHLPYTVRSLINWSFMLWWISVHERGKKYSSLFFP